MKRLLLLMTAVCTLISSCAVTEKKAKEWAYNNKGELAKWCSDCFPVKPIEVIKGDTVVRVDSILSIDSVIVQVEKDCPDGTKIVVDCPPAKTITRVVNTHTSDTVKVRDTAKERVLEDGLKDRSDKLDKMTESRDKYRKWFFISLAVVAVYSLLRIKRIL